jgi:hypothetical protein
MRYWPVITALLGLAAFGVHDAVVAVNRSQLTSSGTLQARLDSIPTTIGAWTAETMPIDDAKARRSRAFARIDRIYRRGGLQPEILTLLLLAGSPGELGAHDPERCYGGVGYKPVGTRGRKIAKDTGLTHLLWSRGFETETVPPERIEVSWGWTDEGHWQAAEDARFEFAGRDVIYKLYVSRRISPSADAPSNEADPIADFLGEFAPLARVALGGAK